LIVEAGPDGRTWSRLGTLDGLSTRSFSLPGEMLPAREIWIRLRGGPAGGKACSLQVSNYAYRATLAGEPLELRGKTEFLAVTSRDPRLEVAVEGLGDLLPGGRNLLEARVVNRTGSPIPAKGILTVSGRARRRWVLDINDLVGEKTIRIPYQVPDAGSYDLDFQLEKCRVETSFQVPEFYRTSFGETLSRPGEAVQLWWASSGWKISRTRPVPEWRGVAIGIRAARNEVEAAQLVVRPGEELRGFQARAGSLQGPGGATIPAENVEVLRVSYVPVTRPTDHTGVAAPWPDPLPPLRGPIDLSPGKNQPLWVAVKVPRGIPGGIYRGNIHLTARDYSARAPLQVKVYGFDLPDRMTCTSAFGFSAGNVFRYQKVSSPGHRRQVLEKYWESFSAHHISPYDPAPLDRLPVKWPERGEIEQGKYEPSIDWSGWDAAMELAIDRYHFNTFRLGIPGMGGGTFHSRREPELRGYREDTPRYRGLFRSYCRAVETHLRNRGWLDEAYVYWFDEPAPRDYEFVMNGFRKLREAAPGIQRMLTEQVEPALVGGPNIWCPLSASYDHRAAEERRKQGDKFWWYVCTGPKAPYCTLFIDHPATELRVWLWQTWKRKIDGILVWQTNYWTSSAAYPDARHPQNPYEDPMGWVSGYSTPKGVRRAWGNGDGRFIYPPEAARTARQKEKVLQRPVSSIRWEMLRDGIEDYEYLAILRRLLESRGGKLTASARETMGKLLEVPGEISESRTTFTRDPAPIEKRRDEIARAIEKLSAPGE
jgi:hypothetical protein